MARKHGRNTNINIDGNDMSTYIDASDFNVSVDSHDVTAYGDDNRQYIDGLIDATFTCSGHYDDDAGGPDTILRPLLGAGAITIIRQPEGTGTGLAQQSFSAIPTAYDESNPVDGQVTFSADYQVTGAITLTAQA